ncbi:FliI/YscN family ATPase [Botrimarina hoheduenensis]|uniref:Flagellum-specific ATP synthase n=1 Tax=Botrimarina hoheduenensis TaxID=2528000 RepID=A0A5C5VYZ3_9BACT|nr:FliI/YscN family ATPase [Botrimarina hoheduenensis]TWT43183.1 Flagellum-specific ATP synthase [Botrimarina hoheduenensis]
MTFDIPTNTLDEAMSASLSGTVVETTGMLATVADFPAPVGAAVEIRTSSAARIAAEVVGFKGRLTMISPFGSLAGVRKGHTVILRRTRRTLPVGDALLGRVLNAHGEAVDGRPQPARSSRRDLNPAPVPAIDRPRIDEALPTGVRAIDGVLTCGRGQRLGVFAGAGVGKSTLLGMMARYSQADVIVIGLVGERGREVNEFLERDLGADGLRRSVVVVSTSNEPPLMRLQAAGAATAIAEHFRDQGKDVLLLIDSITRTALASRELGLAAGEPPTTRGFPPSTFAMLPQLVERAGRTPRGSITAFYSVLVEGDDPNDPIADTMRGLLDGHLWLSRDRAAKGFYPAIDVGQSISRLMPELVPAEHLAAAGAVRRLIATRTENEDLIAVGAYRRGADPAIDASIELGPEIDQYLTQANQDHITAEDAKQQLLALGVKAAALLARQRPTGPAPNEMTPNLRRAS